MKSKRFGAAPFNMMHLDKGLLFLKLCCYHLDMYSIFAIKEG